MILYRTTEQEKDALIPTRSDFGKILLTRHTNLSSKVRRDISLSEIGESGENKVVEVLQEFGSKDWIYLKNVWLDKGGRYESDIIVITKSGIYVFEVKNYEGYFEYDNGDCKINNYDLSENCIAQANRAYKKMQSICNDAFIDAKVHGAIVFIGEYNPVEIKSSINNIEVIQRSGLKSYIERMVDEEKNFQGRQIDIERLMKQLNHYSMPDPFRFSPLSDEDFIHIRRGICCSRCYSFDLDIDSTNYIKCDCGLEEPKEEALIRSICEYGVLTYNQTLNGMKIFNFIDCQISQTFLYKTLNMHFKKVNPNSRYGYINKNLPLDKLTSQFTIAKPKKLHLNKESLIIYTHSDYMEQSLR